jgi:hypothetical protein
MNIFQTRGFSTVSLGSLKDFGKGLVALLVIVFRYASSDS